MEQRVKACAAVANRRMAGEAPLERVERHSLHYEIDNLGLTLLFGFVGLRFDPPRAATTRLASVVLVPLAPAADTQSIGRPRFV